MLAPREARKRLGLSPQEAPGPEGATGWSVCQGKEHIWRDSCAAQHQSTASVQDCTDLRTADKVRVEKTPSTNAAGDAKSQRDSGAAKISGQPVVQWGPNQAPLPPTLTLEQGTQPLRVPAHRAPSARTHSHPPPLGPGAGKRLQDPDLGSASAPCGRPAPDPAGLRRQKRPAEGPGRKLEPRGREGGSRRPPRDAAAPLLSLSFSLRFPPPSPEEKTNKEEQIAGRRSASRTLPSPAPPPNPIQVGSSIFSGVARERPRGAGGGPRSEGRSREPCRADPGGPHSRRRRRRRVGWKGREPPPLPPPPPGWAPFAVDAGGPGRGFIALNGFEPMKLDSLKKDGQLIV
ncbi:hypothetical protein R6Z07F_018009 [Ovis aries]